MSGRHAIRKARVADLPQLKAFFAKAYGPLSVFQSADFVTWFLGGASPSSELLNAYLAADETGAVVAHYGYIPTTLHFEGADVPHIWGVNAYTLPELRGGGLGRDLVEAVRQEPASFGVIGFTETTADFYAKLGFNVFEKARFRRHVLVLDPEIQTVLQLIGTDQHAAASRLAVAGSPPSSTDDEWRTTTDASTWDDTPPPVFGPICTPRRTRSWLDWRYSARSLLPYRTRCVSNEVGQRAVIAFRSIELAPTGRSITRVVDLYGDVSAARVALLDVCRAALAANHLYVEHGSIGTVYDGMLEELGFVLLEGDDQSLLPSLTSPVAFRPNTEYVGLLPGAGADWMTRLRTGAVYFTAADSDRDRRGRLEG